MIKVGSPSFPAKLTLETDSAGSASGTLIDPDATATQSTTGGIVATENNGKSFSTGYATNGNPYGVKFVTKARGYIKSFTVPTSQTVLNRCFLKNSAGAILATGWIVAGK